MRFSCGSANESENFTTESEKEALVRSGPESSSSLLTETLDQLLASRTFSRSGQLKRLLVYLRDATVSTDPAVWSETSIGAIAFGRRDFNSRLDTIVRVEMMYFPPKAGRA